jgi:hypothetical protein
MNHRFGIPGLLILFVLGSGAPAVRAQDGLYAPSVPTDAALVRVVNLQTSKPAPRVDIGPLRFAPVAAGEVTPYRPAPPGVYVVGGRAAGVEFLPEPGKFYSIVADSDGALTVVEDEAHRDPARAQIVLFQFQRRDGESCLRRARCGDISPPFHLEVPVPSLSTRFPSS